MVFGKCVVFGNSTDRAKRSFIIKKRTLYLISFFYFFFI